MPDTPVLMPAPLPWRRVRWGLCWHELRLLLRRWWAALVVAVPALGVLSWAALAWVSMPLLRAAQAPALEALGWWMLLALPPALLCSALLPLMLPAPLLAQERAWPLTALQRHAADAWVALGLQLPWWLLCLASLALWGWQQPAWLTGHWGAVWAGLPVSMLLALAWAVLAQAWRRAPARAVLRCAPSAEAVAAPSSHPASPPVLGLWAAWWGWRIRRGRAPGLLLWWSVAALGQALCALALWLLPHASVRVVLAAHVVWTLWSSRRVLQQAQTLQDADHNPWLAAWPLPLWRWRALTLSSALAPTWLGLAVLALLMRVLDGPYNASPRAFALYLACGLLLPLWVGHGSLRAPGVAPPSPAQSSSPTFTLGFALLGTALWLAAALSLGAA
ncbi:hypothetical protein ACG0Z6_05280 [Roseateles sp. BYS180W]|uniref:ABC transporter permease n=1 Tax=Roseateles rivi TaxID=3299028 RepID=A0ABW7FTL4_9BURK